MAGCDAEIGSVKRGWHRCNKKTVVTVYRKIKEQMYELNYCEQHKHKIDDMPACAIKKRG